MVSESTKLQAGMSKNTTNMDRVGNSINGLRSEIQQLKAARDGSFRTNYIQKYNKPIKETEKKLHRLENLPSKKHANNWTSVAAGINQASEIIGKIGDSLGFTKRLPKQGRVFNDWV